MNGVLIAWELGGGYGHLAETLPLARALVVRGCRVTFALRDPAGEGGAVAAAGFEVVRSPRLTPPAGASASPLGSYAEVLAGLGYADVEALGSAVDRWLELLGAVRPGLLVADHAPTALLAARVRGLRSAAVGTGFCVPPVRVPLPAAGLRGPLPDDALLAIERPIVDAMAAVLRRHGARPLAALGELFGEAEPLLLTVPELDHFGARPEARYWGTLADATAGEAPAWPEWPGTRVFAYLSARYQAIEPLLAALIQRGLPTLVHLHGAAPRAMPRLQSANLRVAARPVRVDRVLAEAKLVVSNGGHGLTYAALRAGRPVIACPMNGEQTMMARRLAAQGLGRNVAPIADTGYLLAALVSGTDDPAFHSGAGAFAARHAQDRPVLDELAARCVELAAR